VLKDVLGFFRVGLVGVFLWVFSCLGDGGGKLKRNIIQHKPHESSGNKMKSKLIKLLLGEAI